MKEQAEVPMVYEVWTNGVTKLMTNMPFVITHIILPNGQVLNTSIYVQSQIPVLQLTRGLPWAIIVTDKGTWYNISPIYLPGLVWNDANPSRIAGIPWDPSVLNLGLNPEWGALQGIKKLNNTLTPLPSTVFVSNIAYTAGLTGKEVILYLNSTTQWINITYYAPISYIGSYKNLYGYTEKLTNPYFYYWEYQGVAPPGILTAPHYIYWYQFYSDPKYFPNFFILLTSNPYINLWEPLWEVAQYWQYVHRGILGGTYSTAIPNPEGGIYFRYSYVNATIGVYVPTNITNNLPDYYYIYFRDFEITNLSAFVPNSTYRLDQGPHAGVYIKGGEWVDSPISWIDAPLVSSLPTGEIGNAYNQQPSLTYDINGYVYAPTYEAFPVYPDYENFSAYFGVYYLPAYHFSVYDNLPFTGETIVSDFVPGYNYYTLPNIPSPMPVNDFHYLSSSTLLRSHYAPIEVFKLAINLEKGVILNYGYNLVNGTWILLYEGKINVASQYYQNVPVYIVIPQGTYLLAIA